MTNQSFAGPMVLPNFVTVQGCQLVWKTNTTLTVMPGQISNMGTGNFVLSYPNATVINIAVNGLNGLDTGTLAASTLYAVYAIGSTSGLLPPGFLFSLNQTNTPIMPAGTNASLGTYDLIKRIGWWFSNSSTHLASTLSQDILYHGVRFYQYNTAISVGSITLATSLTEQNWVTTPPNTIVQFNGVYTPNSDNNTIKMSNASTSGTGLVIASNASTAATTFGPFLFSVGADATTTTEPAVWLIATSASDTLTLNVTGFYDTL